LYLIGRATEDEELGAGCELDDEEAASAEPEPKQKNRFPAFDGDVGSASGRVSRR
jgi:hypothetical protein